jgi:hypothetical protein
VQDEVCGRKVSLGSFSELNIFTFPFPFQIFALFEGEKNVPKPPNRARFPAIP